MALAKHNRHKRGAGGIDKTGACFPTGKWDCTKCDRTIDDEDEDSVLCGVCKEWCHKKCAGLTEKTFRMLKESGEDVWWVCADCRKNDGDVRESGRSRLEAKLDKVMSMLMSVMTRLAKLEERKPELTERDLDERIETKVNEALEEMQEREKRRMNVVFMNVPESEADTPEERKKEDLEKIATIVRSVSDVTKDDMTDPTRLGAKVIGKDKRPRMLRVTVRNEETKKKLLTSARKIEGKGRDRVYINQDRTLKEREIFRK